MGMVKFDRVRLTGFGPYRETADFTFSDWFNVLIAPNETGKSTLVAGINALLFGLPQTNDEKVFGQARYRNWDHPLRFEGELFCTVAGEEYRLRRDFQTNQFSLAQFTDGTYRELMSGTHNPRAQRRNLRYEEMLKALFGLSSQELFAATFCLTQPLPEADELDGRVQELLSGTGVGFKQVTARLTEELREITRFTGRRGVTAKDAFDPRILERLEAEIAETKEGIDRDRELVDQLETYRRGLAKAEKQRIEKKEELIVRERMLTLWSEWKQLKESYEAARVVYTQVQKSREVANELASELRRIEGERAACPWGSVLPSRTGEILQELESITAQKNALQREIGDLEAEEAKEEEIQTTWERNRHQFTLDWPALGPRPALIVQRRQDQAREALASWDQWQQLKAADEENRQVREEEFALFNGANEEILEEIKMYQPRQALLRSALENATLKWERAKEELKMARHRVKLRLGLTIITAMLGGGLPGLLVSEGAQRWLWLGGGILFGAAVGALAGRFLFPVAAPAKVRKAVTENEVQVKAALQTITDFEERVKPFIEKFSDLSSAYRRWEQLLKEKEEITRRQGEFSRRELGGFPGPAENCPIGTGESKVNERWHDLQTWAQVVEPTVHFSYLRDLIIWLEERTPQWWDQLLNEAEAYEEKSGELERAAVRRAANKTHLEKERAKLAELNRLEDQLRAEVASLLETSGDDYQEAKRLWQDWQQLGQKAERNTEALRKLCASQRVNTVEELEAKSDDLSLKAQALYSERQKLIAKNPGLAALENTVDPEQIEADYRARQENVELGQAELKAAEAEIHRLTTEIARLEGQKPVNIAQAEERLAELEALREELEIRCAALTLAYEELTGAISDFQSTYRVRLAEATTKYYQDLTGLPERRVELNEEFQVMVVIDGRPVAPAQLSYGARDQLYIALRLGIAHLLADETVLPFIFDDPFLNCDAERLANIQAALQRLAVERQIILLSHRIDFAQWGTAVKVSAGV